MKNYTHTEITYIIERFNEMTLPKPDWNHEAHIILAFWYNLNFDFDAALTFVRRGIKEYNLSVGTLNTENSGYHETITVFWMIKTKNFIVEKPDLNIDELINRFLCNEQSQFDIVFQYYTKEFLFSNEVRKAWANGNLQQIYLK